MNKKSKQGYPGMAVGVDIGGTKISAKLVKNEKVLILAFMGMLRHPGHNNCLASATGARQNSPVGNIFYP